MANQESSVGAHIAELYNSIHQHQQNVEDAKGKVKEAEAELEKVKTTFANYLKEAGVDKLLAPVQTELFASPGASSTGGTGKERKPRTSSADKASEVERNRSIYTSSYPLGLDDKTGLPKRYKGRGSANDTINAQMADDLRDFLARENGEQPAATPEAEKPTEAPVADAVAAPEAPAAKTTTKKPAAPKK